MWSPGAAFVGTVNVAPDLIVPSVCTVVNPPEAAVSVTDDPSNLAVTVIAGVKPTTTTVTVAPVPLDVGVRVTAGVGSTVKVADPVLVPSDTSTVNDPSVVPLGTMNALLDGISPSESLVAVVDDPEIEFMIVTDDPLNENVSEPVALNPLPVTVTVTSGRPDVGLSVTPGFTVYAAVAVLLPSVTVMVFAPCTALVPVT